MKIVHFPAMTKDKKDKKDKNGKKDKNDMKDRTPHLFSLSTAEKSLLLHLLDHVDCNDACPYRKHFTSFELPDDSVLDAICEMSEGKIMTLPTLNVCVAVSSAWCRRNTVKDSECSHPEDPFSERYLEVELIDKNEQPTLDLLKCFMDRIRPIWTRYHDQQT